MDENTRIRRRREGRKRDAGKCTRSRWRELDAIQEKRNTEPENWPFQCFCSYRYGDIGMLRRHMTHANKYSPTPAYHHPFVSRHDC